MTSLPGWTWDDVLDQLTTSRMMALRENWKKHPPVHKLVAAFVGYEPPTPPEQHMTAEMVEHLIKTQGGVLISGADLGGPFGGQYAGR